MKLAVIGAGAWGTALAILLSENHRVSLCVHKEALASEMRRLRENTAYLPGFSLPNSLDIDGAFSTSLLPLPSINAADLLIIATPLAGLRASLLTLRESYTPKSLLWVCKGLEGTSAKLPHQIVTEVFNGSPWANFPHGLLTGPSFAQEVARGLPTAITLVSSDADFARHTALLLHSSHFRLYASDDVVGSEIAGAVKNVMAISTGICDGLDLGNNARAALMTRGLAEMARLGIALGGKPQTFLGLAGMGDLVLTCTGDLSRNRKVGLALADGKNLPQILAELGHVAEGVSTVREVVKLAAQYGVEMPIAQAVDAVLHHGLSAHDAVSQLLERNPTSETR